MFMLQQQVKYATAIGTSATQFEGRTNPGRVYDRAKATGKLGDHLLLCAL
jgi:hypothetical protein